MLNFFKKLFGGQPARPESTSGRERQATQQRGESRRDSRPRKAPRRSTAEPDPVGFVQFVVENLVDAPERVKIECIERGRDSEIRIHCAKEDRGKVIGRNGKTIAAIRTLVAGAGGRMRKKYNVELVE